MSATKSLPLRRSERTTKGKVPARYVSQTLDNVKTIVQLPKMKTQNVSTICENQKGESSKEAMSKPSESSKVPSSKVSSSKVPSGKIRSSKSLKRRQLEIDLEMEKRLAEIEKRLVEKEAMLKKAELDSQSASSSNYEDEEIKTQTNKSAFIQNWVESTNNHIEKLENPKPQLTGAQENMAEELKLNQFMARQCFSKELPIFSGEPGEWMNFINQFNETTEICGFSKAENIVRLQKSLKGKAKESVNALLSFTQEVDKIINTLQRRFGRPDIIIQDLIDNAKRLPDLREDRLDNILDFSNRIQNLAVTMQSLKCNEHLSNPQLLNDIVKKLNTNLKLEWGKRVVELKFHEKGINIIELSLWLEEMSEAIMYVVPEQEHDKRKKYVCTASIQQGKTTYRCKFCKKDGHKVEKCNGFKKLTVEKRWDWVRENKLCFTCLGSSHHTKFCKSKKKCDVNGCFYRHHPFLHKEAEIIPETPEEQVCHQVSEAKKPEVLLRIAPVELIGPKGKINTYALFDEGSTITMVDAVLTDEIGATGPTEPLKISWTNSMTCEELLSKKVSFKIRGQHEDALYVLNNVRTVHNLSLPVQSINSKSLTRRWNYLRHVNIPSMHHAKPQILIGQDNIDLIIPREVHEGGKNQPVLSKSKLGWVVHGNIGNQHYGRVDKEFSCFINHQYEDLDQLVKNSFKIESLGVKYHTMQQHPDDIRAAEILQNTTRKVGPNRWETGLIWRYDELNLPYNKFTALNRLKSIEKKMDRDKNFANAYEMKISEYIQKGYARKLSKEELLHEAENVWYLPHFGVTNSNKPGKLRFVFDAAAKTKGISLNDVLLKGPDLLNSLLGIIFKFRQRNIAITGDIRDMFHQVQIRTEDRNAQRFLWRETGKNDENPQEYEMIVMIFGAVSSPTSAQYVMRKNAEQYLEEFPDAVRAITEQHYVDDYLDSLDTVDEAKKLTSDVIEVHRRGGFTIRNWCSNSKDVLRTVPLELRNCNDKDMNLEKELPLPIERILGLFWNPNQDAFSFSIKWNKENLEMLTNTNVTKREVLKTVMAIFDPFGFLSSFTIEARILLQDIWRSKIGWDDELNEEMMKKWRKWVKNIEKISYLSIPRCYVANIFEAQEIQIHIFCDASAQAYSAVAYLRIKKGNSIHTSFVMAKSRVAPIRQMMSIPRLELQAAVLGSRLGVTIKENHNIKIDTFHYWTDSKTVIGWIKTDSVIFKPFVAHRVAEIIEITDAKSWKWVPTKENVADNATRDNNPQLWELGSRWLEGPLFLQYGEERWPPQNIEEKLDSSELKKNFVGITKHIDSFLKEALPEIKRFSSWVKLLRATAWMLRFARKSQRKGELTPIEINAAENLWIKCVQNEDFFEEMYSLKQGKNVESSSKLFKLSPILDSEGILRLKSRVVYSDDLGEDTKYPIILDPKNNFTKLLIFHYHCKAAHNGQEFVVNELRQRYWILNIRTAVRSSWNRCQWCRNKRARPQIPEMAPLPRSRLTTFVRPFTIVGMDYFGPMMVSVGRRREKRYGVLFTCMSTRAVHLELAQSLTTDLAVMAIRRLIGRRGCPRKIMSDNGTNLRGAAKELREALKDFDQNKITAELTTNNIEFYFIPPSAPHMGGSWERLIKSIKTSLKEILKEKIPHEEVLHTLLVEAEHIVNSRPLVHVSLDHADAEALTPNHFLLGTSSAAQVPGKFDENDLFTKKQWRISQLLTDHFWRRWIKEYLPVLTKRTKWFKSSTRKIKIGDVVIIVDSQFLRNTWPKGIVSAVYPGTDGNVRVVDVKTNVGTYRRPVTKLCLLDVDEPREE